MITTSDKERDNIWLQGGPFLEISFVLQSEGSDSVFIRNILKEFEHLGFKSNIADDETIIFQFITGYLYDETDLHSDRLHSARFSFNYEISGNRLCNLQLDRISSELIKIDLYFYEGGGLDALDWGQIAIKDNDYSSFIDLFKRLYFQFKFPLGTITIENWCLDLFETDYGETFPNEKYKLSNVLLNNSLINRYNAVILDKQLIDDNIKAKELDKDTVIIIKTAANML